MADNNWFTDADISNIQLKVKNNGIKYYYLTSNFKLLIKGRHAFVN